MNTRIAAFAGFLALVAVNTSLAAPVSYSFSTGVNTFSSVPGLFGTSVSGSFMYDAAAPHTFTTTPAQNPASSFIYGPYSVPGVGAQSSYMGLSATISGGTLGAPISFSDVFGSTNASNNGLTSPPGAPPQDILSLDAEPFGPTGTHNITTFSLNGYTLWNMRLFWLADTLGGDFLTDQNLPGVLPGGQARLSLDFVPDGSTSGTPLSFAFYDGVFVTPIAAIPEPETYAMLLAGLGLLGFAARRRKKLLRGA